MLGVSRKTLSPYTLNFVVSYTASETGKYSSYRVFICYFYHGANTALLCLSGIYKYLLHFFVWSLRKTFQQSMSVDFGLGTFLKHQHLRWVEKLSYKPWRGWGKDMSEFPVVVIRTECEKCRLQNNTKIYHTSLNTVRYINLPTWVKQFQYVLKKLKKFWEENILPHPTKHLTDHISQIAFWWPHQLLFLSFGLKRQHFSQSLICGTSSSPSHPHHVRPCRRAPVLLWQHQSLGCRGAPEAGRHGRRPLPLAPVPSQSGRLRPLSGLELGLLSLLYRETVKRDVLHCGWKASLWTRWALRILQQRSRRAGVHP